MRTLAHLLHTHGTHTYGVCAMCKCEAAEAATAVAASLGCDRSHRLAPKVSKHIIDVSCVCVPYGS